MNALRTPYLAATLAGLVALVALLVLGIAPARAADPGEPLVLVAKRKLNGNFYGSTILITKPVGGDQHVGFIINRPTKLTMGRLFPDHPPSQKLVDPVYLGGPLNTQVIFALVKTQTNPGNGSIQIARDVYVVSDSATMDKLIETTPGDARFFAGMVAWSSGELREELEKGLWYTLEPEAKLVLRPSTDGMWEELVLRMERRAGGI
jgi:putative transcriptional regulator